MADDEIAKAVGGLQLTADTTSMGPPPPKPKITDLPLPQELKDKIWGYLLEAGAVHQTPQYHYQAADDMDHAAFEATFRPISVVKSPYKFHTAILRVNKTIGNNATKFLYKQNRFILLRFRYPAFRWHLHALQVPVVASDRLNKFKHHSFVVEYLWQASPLTFIQPGMLSDLDEGTVLILESDMPKVWTIMRVLCHASTPKRVFVLSEQDKKLVLDEGSPHPLIGIPTTRITARDTQYHTLTSNERENILQQIRGVTGLGYDISFTGFDLMASKIVKRDLSPDVIWLRAMWWDRLDLLLEIKQQADLLAVSGQDDAADRLYACISKHRLVSVGISKNSVTDDTGLDSALERTYHLDYDVYMSRAWLALKHGLLLHAKGRMDQIKHSRLHNASVAMSYRYLHLVFQITSVGICSEDPSAERIERSFSQTLQRLKRFPSNILLQHDISVLERSLKAAQEGIVVLVTPNDMSVNALPFPVFDSQPESTAANRPHELVGWQDKKHLAKLSDKDHQAIHATEKKHGIPMSSL